jgi:tRNA1(Val) A37 N6-methylase TrmN6
VLDTEYQKKPYIQRLIAYQEGTDEHIALYRVFTLHCGAIGLFKPITAMEIYSRFKPTSVLDPCMGWGGRLTGACVLDIPNYIGIDCNVELKEPYQRMKDMLVNELGTKTKISLLFQDALTVNYSLLDYDCVLTSPPYYNIEIYEGTTRKSHEDWNTFYKKLFAVTYKYLKQNGYFCLNVNIEIYNTICIDLLGEADIVIPLKKKLHPKNKYSKNMYREFIYVWNKTN